MAASGEDERGRRERAREVRAAAGERCRAEDGRRDQHRDQARGVVEVDRRLRGRGGEDVDRELGDRCDQHHRRREHQQAEREHEPRDVAEPAPGERGREDLPRVRDGRPEDPARRAAHLAVAREEARASGPVEVRDHDLDRDQRDREPRERDGRSGQAPASRDRVPDAETRHYERDLLLGRRGEQRAGRERDQPVLVEEPDREQEQRARERDGMELVQRQPLRGRVEEVGEREAQAGALGLEVLAGQPEDREGAERDGDRLRDEQNVRARPREPERREGDQDRVEVSCEAGDLVAAQARDRERVAVRGRPDRLHHVAEVEAAGLERPVAQNRERGEARRVSRDRCPEEGSRGPHAATARSRTSRHRRPSTASLA